MPLKILYCAIIFGFAAVAVSIAQPPASGNWQLVWSDEFDSGSTPQYPNTSNWGYESGYVRNHEWQYYTNDLQNAYCQDGLLHIKAMKHPAGTYPTGSYTGQDGTISSASLVSRNKVQFQYGWLEMRARIDTQWGSWPAFWTLGFNGEWPDNGECDIMEYYRNMLKFNVAWWKTGDARWTARWDGETVNLSSLHSGWADDFHVWSMEWDVEQVKLYMDGVLYNTWNSSQDSGDSSIQGFQQPHYIILNQAIGGTAGGDASGLIYPTRYEIDWVRWYQQAPDPDDHLVDDDNAAITYSGTWGTWEGNPGYFGTEHYSETAGSDAIFIFTGSKVTYYGFKRNDLGFAEILLDGQSVGTVDCYNSSGLYFEPLYESPELPYAQHTLAVRVTGQKAAQSSGTEIIVDAFRYSTAQPDQTPPAAPANVSAAAAFGTITLNWDANTEEDWALYKIYRSQTPGSYPTAALQTVTANTFIDADVAGGITYYYVVTAVDTAGNESGYSEETHAPGYRGDLSLDGRVDLVDIAELSSGWQSAFQMDVLLDIAFDWLQTPSVYVSELSMEGIQMGGFYFGRSSVHVKDSEGASIPGAVVKGQWSGSVSQLADAITGSDGTSIFASPGLSTGGVFNFTVYDIVKDGYFYNSALNIENSDTITLP